MNDTLLFAALFISDHWYASWLTHKDSLNPNIRRIALKHKTIALVRFDQMITLSPRLPIGDADE